MGANAQTTVPTFTAGAVLTAAQMNQSARTGTPVFATTADRDAAFGGAGEKTLAEGQTCYIEATPNRLQVYDGTAWLDVDLEWQTWSPTLTNMTLGNGVLTAKYMRQGKFITAIFDFQLGSTSSMGTNPQFTLPVAAPLYGNDSSYSAGAIWDNGTAYYQSWSNQNSTTTLVLYAISTGGTYAQAIAITAVAPMTWTTNDAINVTFVYEAA